MCDLEMQEIFISQEVIFFEASFPFEKGIIDTLDQLGVVNDDFGSFGDFTGPKSSSTSLIDMGTIDLAGLIETRIPSPLQQPREQADRGSSDLGLVATPHENPLSQCSLPHQSTG